MTASEPKNQQLICIEDNNGPSTIAVNELELSNFLVLATDDELETEKSSDLLHTVKDGETMPKMTEHEITCSAGADSTLQPDVQLHREKEADSNLHRLAGEAYYDQFVA